MAKKTKVQMRMFRFTYNVEPRTEYCELAENQRVRISETDEVAAREKFGKLFAPNCKVVAVFEDID